MTSGGDVDRIGWIGLGAMGAPMAAHLADAGYPVSAYDVVHGRAAALAGVSAAGSPAAAADGAGLLVLMVATPEQCEQALFGPAGAAAALAPGAVVVVMATVGPAAVAGWAARLAEAGIETLDAPVSGGQQRAAAGDLLIMVAGAAPAVARARALVDVLARQAPEVGPAPGDGQRIKLVKQLLSGVHIAAAAEALALAEGLGLDPAACWEVIRHGAAASFMLDDRGERMLGPQPAPVRSAMNIFVKDLGLALAEARAAGQATPVAAAAAQLYLQARQAGLGSADDSALRGFLRSGSHQEGPAQPSGKDLAP
jgi:3-hydroxyisobutyrate dehydrogenase/putative dehydrogenase